MAASMSKSAPVRKAVDAIWPSIDAADLVRNLLESRSRLAAAAGDILSASEQALLLREVAPARARTWTVADRFLVDEVMGLLDREPSLGHVVLDEAQDLSGMQLRAVGRRCSTGSATILGDLAQGTTLWSLPDWTLAMNYLGKPDAQLEVLNRSYRVPSAVIDFASRLLPVIAPGTPDPESVPGHVGLLEVVHSDELQAATLSAVLTRLASQGSVAVIVAQGYVDTVHSWLTGAGLAHDTLSNPEAAARLTLASVHLAKGLEYDHVVVVEPGEIVASESQRWQGLRRLYVVLTRAVSTLTVVHAEPLPPELSGSAVGSSVSQ
jgi:DNA helicase IV